MNKSQLVDAVAASTGMTKKSVGDVVEAVLEAIVGSVKAANNVTITGFGTFKSVHQKASTKRNPKTGAPVKVPAKNVPRFSAGKQFRETVA